ncbi:MAG: SDR family oxidoreductase [Phycisphaerae bacterium]|jgi:NAD(P)-dependent dehydrogenase (short-subunit alcohol dehydrogenase family)
MTEGFVERPLALVTGAGSGIGREVSLLLSAAGWRCVLAGRREERLKETAALLDGPSLIAPCDLESAAAAERLVDAAQAWGGPIDAVVNNAGWSPVANIEATDGPLVERIFATNAVAPAAIIARAWKAVAARSRRCVAEGRTPPRAVIVNVSTMGVHDPFEHLYAYASAKASLHLMARCAANEGARLGIKAFAVAPGAVETELLRQLADERALPRAYTLAPRAVAEIILACIRGDRDADNGGAVWAPSPPMPASGR